MSAFAGAACLTETQGSFGASLFLPESRDSGWGEGTYFIRVLDFAARPGRLGDACLRGP